MMLVYNLPATDAILLRIVMADATRKACPLFALGAMLALRGPGPF